MKRFYMLPVMVMTLFFVMAAGKGAFEPQKAEANFPGAENIYVINQHCTSLTTVRVTIAWQADFAGTQWADLSHNDNNFAFGTYIAHGPMSSGQQAITLDLNANTVYFLRINTAHGFGWVPASNAFMTMMCTPYIVDGTTGSISHSDSRRHHCDDLRGRWDNDTCFIVRFDCERERDRDRDRDWDRDNDRDRRWEWDRSDRGDFDRDRDRDWDDRDRDGDRDDRFHRDRDFNCDFDGIRIIFRS
jgi:hypothetical protein